MAGICERFTANIISKIVKKTDEERCQIFSVLLKIAATFCQLHLANTKGVISNATALHMVKSIFDHRTSSLALIDIYRGVLIDYKRAVKIFLELHQRKFEVSDLVIQLNPVQCSFKA